IAGINHGHFRVAGELETQSTTVATTLFTGTLYYESGYAEQAVAMCADTNYLLYQDESRKGHFITISGITDDGQNSISFSGMDAGNDLTDEVVPEYTAAKAMTFEQYFNQFCADSGWEIGVNEIPSSVRTLTFSSEQSSYDRMNSVAKEFGVEIYYSFQIEGTTPKHLYLNVVHQRGADNSVTLRVGSELNKIEVTSDSTGLLTSIYARGATPDGSDSPITLKGYKWTDPDGRYVLYSDGTLLDTVANRSYSRLRKKSTPDPHGSYLNQWRDYEATTQADLLQSALSDLKHYAAPVTNYTVDFAFIPDNISIGDTIHVADEKRNLYVSARVLEISRCYSLPSSSTATLGDYKIEADKVSVALKTAAKLAQATASTAKATATQAYSAANEAANDATDAKETATSAQTTANTAQTNATAAQTTANAAQSTATNAAQVAEKAQATAKAARTFMKSATAPDTTNLPVNAVWITPATTDSNGNTVAASAKTWDGTNWQNTPIESSLIAENIVGKNITGSTFGNTSGTFSIDEGGNITGAVISGSEFISSFKNAPVDESDFADITDPTGQDMLTKGTGTAKMGDGYLTVDGTIDGSSGSTLQTFHTEVGPAGYLSRLYTGGTAESNISAAAQLYLGHLLLSNLDTSGKKVSGFLNGEMLQQLDNSGTVIWTGSTYLLNTTTITPTIPITDCFSGWLLCWANAGTPLTDFFNYTLISRAFVTAHPGHQHKIKLVNGDKFFYVSTQQIGGTAQNNGGSALVEVVAI
ncbi:phage tail spike protein, partial [Lacticaseibacillus sp. 866-1]|uniref:phage tail spike protein n=1 Tax=Lacticaseibacillus sp. 866-1 TaxID=2799576 RepID=UPI00194260FC